MIVVFIIIFIVLIVLAISFFLFINSEKNAPEPYKPIEKKEIETIDKEIKEVDKKIVDIGKEIKEKQNDKVENYTDDDLLNRIKNTKRGQ
jgi:flagellar basal body-associated protein FliL